VPTGTRVFGINSRDFLDKGDRFEQSLANQKISTGASDFTTDLTAFDNISLLPVDSIKVAESGISPETIISVRDKGYNAALIGTDLLMNPRGIRAALASYRAVL
jgi:indole-3-glycerol phosphate synthase